VALLLVTASCGRTGPASTAGSALPGDALEILVWHLDGYASLDRDGDGLAREFKSTESRAALSTFLSDVSPETLVVFDLGDDEAFTVFTNDLKEAGLDYPYAYRPFAEASGNFALLSRLDCVSGIVHEVRYSIAGKPASDRHPIGEVLFTLDTNTTIRVILGHLKSKDFHALGQYEMRRNEARHLGNLVRQRLGEYPDQALLVTACLNDDWSSAVVQQVVNAGISLLDVADVQGDTWTYVDAASDTYSRWDYLLGNSNLVERLAQVEVIRDVRARAASRHRPMRIYLKR